MLDAPYFDVFPNGEMFYLGFSAPSCPGSLGAGGQADCGVIKDFLSGLNGLSVIGSGTNGLHNRANDFSAFFQDDWKIARRLTLNLGLRYDYFGPTTETQGHFVGFIPSEATTVTVPGLGQVVTGGFVQAGNGNLPGFPKVGDGLVKPNYKNFGPRVGFSYQLGDSGKKVLRGGYGIFYDRPNMRLFNSQLFNMPYEMLATAIGTPNENPFVQVPLPSAFPLTISGNPGVFPLGGYPAFLPVTLYPATSVAAYPVPATGLYPDLQDWAIPYIQTFNLGLQTSIADNWLLDVGYVGTEGRKFPRLFSFNQALPGDAGVYGLTTAQSGPFFPGFANLTAPGLGSFLMKSNSNSNYNSLQTSLTKRFSHGLQMLLSYTWSHSLDYYSGSPVSDITLLPGDMVNEQHNYGSSDFDRRHRFVASYLYDLPGVYHGSSAFGKKALNSWSVSGILTLQSGTPFSIYGDDSAFESTVADLKPGRTLQSAIKGGSVESRLNDYFDPTAFVIPASIGDPGFGMLGRNIIRGPKQVETDLSIMKIIPVTEGQHVEFRTEFFNLFNNVSFANPVNIVSSANFGQIASTTTGPRVVQFALKYNF